MCATVLHASADDSLVCPACGACPSRFQPAFFLLQLVFTLAAWHGNVMGTLHWSDHIPNKEA